MQIKNIAYILHYVTVFISEKFYTQIKNIAYILQEGIKVVSRSNKCL